MAFWTDGKLKRMRGRRVRRTAHRRGSGSIDYVLILGVILPLVAMSIVASREILGRVYELLCVLVSWPFM